MLTLEVIIFGYDGNSALEWLSDLGAGALVDRAAALDEEGDLTATGALLCDFETRTLEYLFAARKRDYTPDNPIDVLLELNVSGNVEDVRLERALAGLDEAAKLAVADLLAAEVA